jgi:hypothetical protein
MQDYLNVIYKASENRALAIDHLNMPPRVPQAMPQGYFIYCPNPPSQPVPIQIPNNPVMYHETPTSQAIGSKRHLDSSENDRPAKHTKNEPNYLSKSGFYNKMCEILTDLPKYKKIFTDHDIYFKDMLRPRESISLLFQEITEDLTALKHKNYDVCKYANNCNRKECCAFLNPEDTLKIINAYKYFDIDVYDFKHCKKVWKASIALKSLKALHDATWYIVSRKRLANKLIVDKK